MISVSVWVLVASDLALVGCLWLWAWLDGWCCMGCAPVWWFRLFTLGDLGCCRYGYCVVRLLYGSCLCWLVISVGMLVWF